MFNYGPLFIKGNDSNMTLKKRSKIWSFIFILLVVLLVFYIFGAFVFKSLIG